MRSEPGSGDPPPTLGKRIGQIAELATPVVLGMSSSNVMALVDTAFASRLGAAALGGIGFGVALHWLASAAFLGLASGVQAISARRIGSGDSRAPARALLAALGVVVVIAVPLAIALRAATPRLMHAMSGDDAVVTAGADYLNTRLIGLPFFAANLAFRGMWSGVGRTSVYLITNVLINALHITFDWVLMLGHLGAPRLGPTGAGYAGTLSVVTGTAIYLAITAPRLRLGLRDGARAELPTLLRLSVPAGAESFLLFAGLVTFYVLAARVGTIEVAASHAVAHVMLSAVQLADGFGIAAATLVGHSLGRRLPAEAARFALVTAALAATACLVGSIALAASPEWWVSLLAGEPRTARAAMRPLLLVAAVLPFDAAGVVFARALVGAGAVRIVAVASIGLQWGLFLPTLALAVSHGGGMTTLWLGMALWRFGFFVVMTAAFRIAPWVRAHV